MPSLAPKALARTCCRFALKKKAEDVIIIDLRKLNAPTDYFVICHGNADRQVKAIADSVIDGLKAKGHRPWHVEGYAAKKWILLDFVNVVVHVFDGHTRDFYLLENLWGDAPSEDVE
ncbi:ribosome silencing factor [Candidatus Eisenbacteria bacterium]|uniref:Ribosomal silencing factor RsfS n=1 Tax=Eiseniibacteriota bacterium TaxID=2212470 RepID=A0ABV6YPZ4_UNCEI